MAPRPPRPDDDTGAMVSPARPATPVTPVKAVSPPATPGLRTPRAATVDDDTGFGGQFFFPRRDAAIPDRYWVGSYGTPAQYASFESDLRKDKAAAPWIALNGEKYIEWAWVASHSDNPDFQSDAFINLGLRVPPGADGTNPSAGGGGRRGGGGGGGGGGIAPGTQEAAEATIRNTAHTMGLMLDASQISALAGAVIAGNWSNDRIVDYLAGALEPARQNGTLSAGSYLASIDAIKAMAGQQLVALSTESAAEFAHRYVSGEIDENGLKGMIQAMARVTHPWAASAIDQGITVRSFVLPLRDTIATELERPPEAIDLMDPQWQSMLISTDDKGVQRPASTTEVVSRARHRDEFKTTKRAQDLSAAFATTIRDVFEGRAS